MTLKSNSRCLVAHLAAFPLDNLYLDMNPAENPPNPNSPPTKQPFKSPFSGRHKWGIAILLLTVVGVLAVVRMGPSLPQAAELAGGTFTHKGPMTSGGLVTRIQGLMLSMMGVPNDYSILQFDGGPLKDEWLRKHYSELDGLNILTLHLRDQAVSDAGLKALEGMKSIQQLAVSCNTLSDEAVDSMITMRKLMVVDLSCTGISDDALQKLSALPQIQGLGIDQTQATETGLDHLQALPKLQMLTIVGATDETLALIDPDWQVQRLSLLEANLTEASLPKLNQIKGLQLLSFAEDSVSDEQLQSFRSGLSGHVVQVITEERFRRYRDRAANAASAEK